MRTEMSKWGTVLTERDLGLEIRKEMEHVILSNSRVVADFTNVSMVTSSFADEVFAKLIEELGTEKAKRSLSITNVTPTVKSIINEAIFTRSNRMPVQS